ncbi:hypothetical protein KKG83_03175 [Candidatus Micrarchaeota archaeon]|nr:hypothetical protein [Candidatus Micrarchaeota archaeon]
MKTRGKLLLVLLAALILLYFVYVEGIFNVVSFENGLEKLSAIDQEFELEGKLVPAQKEKISQYNTKLVDLETELSKKTSNEDIKALNYLIDARKELVLMQLNLIEFQETRECSRQLELIDSIMSSAVSARDSVQNYLTNYSSFSDKTTEWNQNVLDTTNSVELSFRELQESISQTC